MACIATPQKCLGRSPCFLHSYYSNGLNCTCHFVSVAPKAIRSALGKFFFTSPCALGMGNLLMRSLPFVSFPCLWVFLPVPRWQVSKVAWNYTRLSSVLQISALPKPASEGVYKIASTAIWSTTPKTTFTIDSPILTCIMIISTSWPSHWSASSKLFGWSPV